MSTNDTKRTSRTDWDCFAHRADAEIEKLSETVVRVGHTACWVPRYPGLCPRSPGVRRFRPHTGGRPLLEASGKMFRQGNSG